MIFRKWPKQEQQPSATARKIAEMFESGEVRAALNAQGISTMSLATAGIRVEASWYSVSDGHHLRYVRVDGDSSFGSSVDAEFIKEAAVRRAQRMLDDKLKIVSERLHL